jgi:hypothetical protein
MMNISTALRQIIPRTARRFLISACLAAGAGGGAARGANAAEIASVSRIAFGPPGTLFVADWVQSKVHALQLPKAAPDAGRPFNLMDLDAALGRALGTSEVKIEDIAARPGSDKVYVAVTYGANGVAAILRATADGRVYRLDLANMPSTAASLADAPDASLKFWNDAAARSFTVTDMKWRDGKLYLAGLSNQSFASSLRIVPYPFGKRAAMASVEMYHTTHDQVETRAPIRAMAFETLDDKPYLVAAYLCTPLVTIPLSALTDGAHVRAKTIAELGDSGIPVNVVPYAAMDFATGKTARYVLVANLFRESSSIPLASIEDANRGAGYSRPVPFGAIAGVMHMGATLDNILRIDNQDAQFFVALRRDMSTGHAQLVSINKLAGFRLSDFDVSEFMFPGYHYATDPAHAGIRKMQNMLKAEEGYAQAVR